MKQLRPVTLWLVVLSSLTFVAIGAIDTHLARLLAPHVQWWRAIAGPPMTAIESAFGFPVSKWATGSAILLVALAMLFFARWRRNAWLLMYVSVAQLTTRLIAGVLKNVFERKRPFETAGLNDQWFAQDGSAFPSGHAAHFWGLFFAIAIAFPRARIPFLVLALFVSFSRVVVNDHYLSDVTASAVIAASVAWGYGRSLKVAESSGHPER